MAATAVALLVGAGGFIFYNTNVLNEYFTAPDLMERRAEYERRYGQYGGIPQPQVTGINLRVEIHPERREAEIRGTYRLVNGSPAIIDSIHARVGQTRRRAGSAEYQGVVRGWFLARPDPSSPKRKASQNGKAQSCCTRILPKRRRPNLCVPGLPPM